MFAIENPRLLNVWQISSGRMTAHREVTPKRQNGGYFRIVHKNEAAGAAAAAVVAGE